MKTWIAGLTALSFLFAAAPVFAQAEDDEPEQQFFIFDGSEIEGKLNEPDGTVVNPRGEETFEELYQTEKKSFMGEIEESGQAGSLD